ncbi:hypothetical protein Tco_1048170 [Tanacetum coccineum]
MEHRRSKFSLGEVGTKSEEGRGNIVGKLEETDILQIGSRIVSGLHFLDFFNDPRIIREQRIAVNWVIEGGGRSSRGCLEAINSGVEV